VYIFEGKPPELKIEQLKQRRERRDEADKELAAAKEAGDQEAIEKYSKRTTKVQSTASPTPLSYHRVYKNTVSLVNNSAVGQAVVQVTVQALR
jgi:flap endonuclease-1